MKYSPLSPALRHSILVFHSRAYLLQGAQVRSQRKGRLFHLPSTVAVLSVHNLFGTRQLQTAAELLHVASV